MTRFFIFAVLGLGPCSGWAEEALWVGQIAPRAWAFRPASATADLAAAVARAHPTAAVLDLRALTAATVADFAAWRSVLMQKPSAPTSATTPVASALCPWVVLVDEALPVALRGPLSDWVVQCHGLVLGAQPADSSLAPHVRYRLTLSPEAKVAFFAQAQTEGLAATLRQPSRPHLHEADLMAGRDPELALRVAQSAGHPWPGDQRPAVDVPLLSAADAATAALVP
jgi:hypothetical protein